MGLKGPGRRAAGVGHQHGGLHLHEAAAVQEIADLLKNLGTLDKGVPNFGIHDQIHIALTVTDIRVGKAMELLWKNLKALGQQNHLRRMDGLLAGLGGECGSLDSHKITDIQLLEILVLLLAHAVSRHVSLDVAL